MSLIWGRGCSNTVQPVAGTKALNPTVLSRVHRPGAATSRSWFEMQSATQPQCKRLSQYKCPQLFCMHIRSEHLPNHQGKGITSTYGNQSFSKSFLFSPHFLLQLLRDFSVLSREQCKGSFWSLCAPKLIPPPPKE